MEQRLTKWDEHGNADLVHMDPDAFQDLALALGFDDLNALTGGLNRLAAYEDCFPLERAQELAAAGREGRLVVFPKVSVHAMEEFISGLHDYFQECAFVDRSVGINGMSLGEQALANALMDALTAQAATQQGGNGDD